MTPEEYRTLATYDAIAHPWSERYSGLDFWEKEFARFYGLLPSGHILDIGCGNARDGARLLAAGYGYTGVDNSCGMLREARARHPECRVCAMDMRALGFANGAFDGFLALASLFHIAKRAIPSALAEIRRVVKPGGAGFAVILEGDSEKVERGSFPNDERLFSRYPRSEFARMLGVNGFEVIEQRERPVPSSPSRSTPATWLSYFVRAN